MIRNYFRDLPSTSYQEAHAVWVVALHAFDSNALGAEPGGSLGVLGQPSLHGEFQASQGYKERSRLKNKQAKEAHGFDNMKLHHLVTEVSSPAIKLLNLPS